MGKKNKTNECKWSQTNSSQTNEGKDGVNEPQNRWEETKMEPRETKNGICTNERRNATRETNMAPRTQWSE